MVAISETLRRELEMLELPIGVTVACAGYVRTHLVEVWVPHWSSRSYDLGIFVNQSAEPIAASDVKLGRRRRGWKRLQRRCLVQCPVRPMGIEVRHVLGQHSLKPLLDR